MEWCLIMISMCWKFVWNVDIMYMGNGLVFWLEVEDDVAGK